MDKDKPKIDAYVCPNLHIVITEQTCEGKTPERVNCMQCDAIAKSLHWEVNQDFRGMVEWYKPTPKEVEDILAGMSKPEANRFREIINQNGLISRPKVLPKDIN